ncbi:hypothetical protein RhiirB3_416385, partial [Rhizophagus irregularis]
MFQTDSIVFMVIIPFLSGARFSISYILNNLCTVYIFRSSNIEHETRSFVGNKSAIKIPQLSINDRIMLGFLSNLDDASRFKNRGTFNLKNFPGMLSYNPIKI